VPATRVLILTVARREEIDVVVGLDAGADDYVVKPFRLAELLAASVHSCGANPKRAPAPNGRLSWATSRSMGAPVGSSSTTRRSSCGPRSSTAHPPRAHAGEVVTREKIMEQVWDEHWYGSTKTLDMHMSVLRKKIASSSASIVTLRHVGYRFDP